jgi:hypothetical protein
MKLNYVLCNPNMKAVKDWEVYKTAQEIILFVKNLQVLMGNAHQFPQV